MKKVVLAILITFSYEISIGQTFDEWFKQKKTQRKYLLEQITAFKVYLRYVQKGYVIARNGLTTIGNIKKGDFNLHDDFFSSLKNVNPTIREYSKVADIISLHKQVLEIYKQTYKYVQTNHIYSKSEIDFVSKVFANLINSCGDDIDELIAVISAGKLDMKDDERLERIEGIYNTLEDKYLFAKSFGDEAKVLAVARSKEKNNIETSRSIYGIEK
ncbi:hypothetical protein [Segetibacter koreensis]|uniref:hypothetical protein n=1 Tax=Segetibacter koreensis TaxID=398037 RepID=UPI0003A325DC|nr:hypothetical protein [Segetibacter koreensis]